METSDKSQTKQVRVNTDQPTRTAGDGLKDAIILQLRTKGVDDVADALAVSRMTDEHLFWFRQNMTDDSIRAMCFRFLGWELGNATHEGMYTIFFFVLGSVGQRFLAGTGPDQPPSSALADQVKCIVRLSTGEEPTLRVIITKPDELLHAEVGRQLGILPERFSLEKHRTQAGVWSLRFLYRDFQHEYDESIALQTDVKMPIFVQTTGKNAKFTEDDVTVNRIVDLSARKEIHDNDVLHKIVREVHQNDSQAILSEMLRAYMQFHRHMTVCSRPKCGRLLQRILRTIQPEHKDRLLKSLEAESNQWREAIGHPESLISEYTRLSFGSAPASPVASPAHQHPPEQVDRTPHAQGLPLDSQEEHMLFMNMVHQIHFQELQVAHQSDAVEEKLDQQFSRLDFGFTQYGSTVNCNRVLYAPEVVFACPYRRDQSVVQMGRVFYPDSTVLVDHSGLIQEFQRMSAKAHQVDDKHKMLCLMKVRWQEICHQYDQQHWRDVVVFGTLRVGVNMQAYAGAWSRKHKKFAVQCFLNTIDDVELQTVRVLRRMGQHFARRPEWHTVNNTPELYSLARKNMPTSTHDQSGSNRDGQDKDDMGGAREENQQDQGDADNHDMGDGVGEEGQDGQRSGREQKAPGDFEEALLMVGLCKANVKVVRDTESHCVYYSEPLGVYVKINLYSDREAVMMEKLSDGNVPHCLVPKHMIRWRGGFLMVTDAYAAWSGIYTDPAQILKWVICVLESLEAYSKLSLVHGDVKPENVLIHGSEALLFDNGETCKEGTRGRRGTRKYMAPEVQDGGRCTHASDMWSVGRLIKNRLAVHLKGDYEAQLQRLNDWMRRLLVTDPKARPTAAELLREVRQQPRPFAVRQQHVPRLLTPAPLAATMRTTQPTCKVLQVPGADLTSAVACMPSSVMAAQARDENAKENDQPIAG